MAHKVALADTSILIDLFHETEKANSKFVQHALEGCEFQISATTKYEFYLVPTIAQLPFLG